MSKHEELIKSLRASAAAMPFDAAVAVQYRAAADALEAQAREIEGLRKDAERAELMLQVSCNHSALEIMRQKAERYDYLTLQHGEYCVADASTAGAIFKGSAADQIIDAAKGAVK